MYYLHSTVAIIALLYASCSYTTLTCPVEHKESKLSIYEKQIMYENIIEFCGIEQNMYNIENKTFQKWLLQEPEKTAYRTMWGTVDNIGKVYALHIILFVLYIIIIAIIYDEQERERKKQEILRRIIKNRDMI